MPTTSPINFSACAATQRFVALRSAPSGRSTAADSCRRWSYYRIKPPGCTGACNVDAVVRRLGRDFVFAAATTAIIRLRTGAARVSSTTKKWGTLGPENRTAAVEGAGRGREGARGSEQLRKSPNALTLPIAIGRHLDTDAGRPLTLHGREFIRLSKKPGLVHSPHAATHGGCRSD